MQRMEEDFINAARDGNIELVNTYIANGVNVNYQTLRPDDDGKWFCTGDTGLILASRHCNIEVVEMLLECGAHTATKNKYDRTALFVASSQGHTNIVKMLLDHAADPNLKDEDGQTSLFAASAQGHTDVVRMLLEKSADSDVQNKNGWTSLMVAAFHGHNTLRVLLENGADPNIKSHHDLTALTLTTNPMIKLLIENQIRWNRRKALIMTLTENGYLQSPSLLSSAANESPLRYKNVLGNERLVRLITSYI